MTTQFPFIASNRDFNKPTTVGGKIDYQSVSRDDLTYFSYPYDAKNPDMSVAWTSKVIDNNSPRVMIFIHGYQNSWFKVTGTDQNGLSGMVTNFYGIPDSPFIAPNTRQISTPYPGPIILFDWPSFYEIEILHPKKSYNEAKNNARKTAEYSTGYLKDLIDKIHKSGKKVDIVCHSMGNYVFQLVAKSLSIRVIDTCLLNAAAISSDSFFPKSTFTNAHGIIQSLVSRTNAQVLWSSHDDALPFADSIDPWGTKYDPPGPGELGFDGPTEGSAQFDSHDLSTFVKKTDDKPGGGASKVHTSYYYLQSTLDQMIALMTRS
jgi:pimeloyl-ACP methyl ester carboxylesterase